MADSWLLVGDNFFHVMGGVVGIVLYLLVPGLALSLALFPRKGALDIVERVGIALFLGLATPFIQYFADKNFFVPIDGNTTLMTLAAVTVIGLAVWQLRLNAGSGKDSRIASSN